MRKKLRYTFGMSVFLFEKKEDFKDYALITGKHHSSLQLFLFYQSTDVQYVNEV